MQHLQQACAWVDGYKHKREHENTRTRTRTKDIRKVKIQGPENICKAFFFFGFTCSTFTTHLYYFSA
jgi:hypothetical protein